MSKKWLTYSLVGIILLSILVSLYLGTVRHHIEQANKTVELALSWADVRDLARRELITTEEVLTPFRETASGVLFKERTLNDLKVNGDLLIRTGIELSWDVQTGQAVLADPNGKPAGIKLHWNYLIFTDETLMQSVQAHLATKFHPKEELVAYRLVSSQGAGFPVLGTSSNLKDLSIVGVGFDPAGLNLAASLGFNIIPQIRTWPHYTEGDLEFVFAEFANLPVSVVLFNDSDLPGVNQPVRKQATVLRITAEKIKELGVPLGAIEFFPQKGIGTVAKYLDKNVVRLHAISDREMPGMTQNRAVDRFTLAATDRNIRALFVRFFPEMGLKDNLDYVSTISSSLAQEGFVLGSPQDFDSVPFSRVYLVLIGLGVIAAGILLLMMLGYDRTGLVLGGLGIAGILGLVLLGQIALARKGLALLSVVIFPVLSVTWFLTDKPSSLGRSIYLLIKTSLVSLIGALLAVGLLADKSFMLKLDQFAGVKLAHILPVLLLMIIFWFLKDRRENPVRKFLNLLDYSVTVKYLLLLGILGVVMLVYITRTGNEGMAVSNIELMLRGKLEHLLSVRPRTKEFLIGHPLLLLTFYLGYRERALPLMLVGAIGQISMVNTFAHVHTPLIISLIRTVHGLWIGILIGVLLVGAYALMEKGIRRVYK